MAKKGRGNHSNKSGPIRYARKIGNIRLWTSSVTSEASRLWAMRFSGACFGEVSVSCVVQMRTLSVDDPLDEFERFY